MRILNLIPHMFYSIKYAIDNIKRIPRYPIKNETFFFLDYSIKNETFPKIEILPSLLFPTLILYYLFVNS